MFPRKPQKKFVTDNKMFLLLDGLDEVKEDLREKCVEAINEFKNEHGLTSLAICSRIEEYQAVQTKLALAGAITLQPLTSEQVDTYFEKFGKSLSSLKQILKNDKTLQELTETPLMLSIMVLAYKDVNIKEIPELKNSKEQRKHLFDAYINRMFERRTRSEKKDFSKEETLHYLGWLANQLIKQNLITYQIEAMQPSLLVDKQKKLYKSFVVTISGLVGMSCGFVIFLFMLGINALGIIGSVAGFGALVVLVVILVLERDNKIEMVYKFGWSWKRAQKGVIFGILGGVSGLSCGIISELGNGSTQMLVGGVILGLMGVLILGFIGVIAFGLVREQVEETNYPGQRLQQTFYNAIYVGLIGGPILGIIIGLLSILILGLSLGMIAGLSGEQFEFDGLLVGWNYGQSLGLGFGVIGILIGILLGSVSGGMGSLLKHYTLRKILIKNGFIPRYLVSFLEYCVDLIFIRRMGGSYIFVHRLLMEHFAEMYIEKENR